MADTSESCLAKIAAAGRITTGQALDILTQVSDRAERMRETGQPDAFVNAAGELASKVKEAVARDRLDALRNAAKRNGIMDEIGKNGGLPKAADTLRSILHGLNSLGRQSVESMWRGRSNGWQAGLDNMLNKAGLRKAMLSGEMDKDVSDAWWKINAGEDAGNSPAAQVAKLYAKTLDHIRDRLNEAGARIGDATDYVTHTSHDPIKMRRAAGMQKTPDEAFAAWWGKTEPRLSEKTFENLEGDLAQSQEAKRRAFGRSVFDSLVSGIHMTVGGAEESAYRPPAFEGTYNIARRVSQDRTLFWKDGNAWHDYMQDYGQFANLHSSVMMSIDRGARQLALIDRMGTNPAANLNQLIRRIQETYRDDIDGVNKFKNSISNLNNVMGRLDGSLNVPANMGLAQTGNAIRTWETMSSLGGVGITHFASIWPTVTSELAHHGISRLESLSNMTKALVQGKGDAQRQEIMADLGAYADGITRYVHSVIGDDSIPGRISAMAGRFMDSTGIHYVFDHIKAGVRAMLSHNLARNLDKDFSAIDPHLSQMLEKYGIGTAEWEKLRGLEDLPVSNDRRYLTPSAAGRIDPALSDKLLSYYSDAAAHAVVTAGVRERAFLLRGTRPGTPEGEMLRFLYQFKMWPVAAMNQVIGREIYMSLSKTEAAWNIGKIVALGVPVGYLRMAINDVASGRPVRDIRKPETLLAAAAQSGGIGILGDFLFGEVNRMGGGLIPTLGGPVVSDADTLVKMYGRFKGDVEGEKNHRNGQFGDLWPDLAHFAVRHIPFANLVYAKGALDYMAWYHLYAAASPGWWERTNRRLQKEQGRTMTGYAPGGGVPWGVPGIYLHTPGGQSSGVLSGGR